MRIGLTILGHPDMTPSGPSIARFAEMVQQADEHGVASISTGEGQTNVLECFSVVTFTATLTKRAKVGFRVTNPVTRDVGVMANGLASLDLISGGRAYLGIGRGDGAVRHVGLKPATVDATKLYFLAVRELLDKGETTFAGRRILLQWPHGAGRRIPLNIIAEGPRMLRLAGAVADGIHVGTGLTPDIIRATLDTIAEGAREAGRDPAELDVWWNVRFSVAETREDALEQGGYESLSSMGNHALRGASYEGKHIPAEIEDRLRRYHDGYDYAQKGHVLHGNVALMQELGLTDYFLERFGAMGSPDDVIERLRQLEALGVDQVLIHAHNAKELQLIGEAVMPALAKVG